MPFFQGATDFEISGNPQFIDIRGDMNTYRVDRSVNVTGNNNTATIAPNHSIQDNRSSRVGLSYHTSGNYPRDNYEAYINAVDPSTQPGPDPVGQLAHQWANLGIQQPGGQYQPAHPSRAPRIDAYASSHIDNFLSNSTPGGVPGPLYTPQHADRHPNTHPSPYPPHPPHQRAQTMPIPGTLGAFDTPSQSQYPTQHYHPRPSHPPSLATEHPSPPSPVPPPLSAPVSEELPHAAPANSSIIQGGSQNGVNNMGNGDLATFPSSVHTSPVPAPHGGYSSSTQPTHMVSNPVVLPIPTVVEPPPPAAVVQPLPQIPSPSPISVIPGKSSSLPTQPRSVPSSTPYSATSSSNQDVDASRNAPNQSAEKKKKKWLSALLQNMGWKKSKKTVEQLAL